MQFNFEGLKQAFVDVYRKDFSPEKISEERLDICKSCSYFTKATSQCKKCGCVMALKTKLSHSECPMGKWGKI